MEALTLNTTIDFSQTNIFAPLPSLNELTNQGSALLNQGVEFVESALTPAAFELIPGFTDLAPKSISSAEFVLADVNFFDPNSFDPLVNTNADTDGFLVNPIGDDFDSLSIKSTFDPLSDDTGFTPLADPEFDALAILGNDDRRSVTTPDSRIGRITLPGSYGTATLVGRFTAITNAHVVESWNGRVGDLTFRAGDTSRGNAGTFAANRTLYWNDDRSTPWKDDFAIVTFSQPIGDRFGWFGTTTRATVTNNFQEVATLTGYSGDRFERFGTPSRDFDYVRGDVSGTSNDWTHRIDTAPGASGSSLVANSDQRVLGVHWGGSSANNHWTPLNRNFFDWIQRADREAAQAYNSRRA